MLGFNSPGIQRLLPRTLLVLGVLSLLGLVGVASAGIWKKTPKDPPLSEQTTPAESLTPAPPAEPPKLPPPPLFPKSLPVIVDKLPEGLANLSSQQCAACHMGIQEEWRQGAHAGSARNQKVMKAAQEIGTATACLACHLPIVNQHAILSTSYPDGDLSRGETAPNPAWNPTIQSEGVTCAACHVREGVVLGTRESSAAPHPLRATEELASPSFCATCHQLSWPGATEALYDTHGEWTRSSWGKAGIRCQDCHMPQRTGLVNGGHFLSHADHAMNAELRRALSILVTLDAPVVQRGKPFSYKVLLQNTGAGHAIPTGAPSRSLQVKSGITRMDGKWSHEAHTLNLARTTNPKPPFETLGDSRIAAGEERLIEHTATLKASEPAGPALFQVQILRSGSTELLTSQVIPIIIK